MSAQSNTTTIEKSGQTTKNYEPPQAVTEVVSTTSSSSIALYRSVKPTEGSQVVDPSTGSSSTVTEKPIKPARAARDKKSNFEIVDLDDKEVEKLQQSTKDWWNSSPPVLEAKRKRGSVNYKYDIELKESNFKERMPKKSKEVESEESEEEEESSFDFNTMGVTQLKEYCNSKNLSSSGIKADLVQRLQEHEKTKTLTTPKRITTTSKFEEYNKMKKTELKDVCTTNSLVTTGSKEDIIQRLIENIKSPTTTTPTTEEKGIKRGIEFEDFDDEGIKGIDYSKMGVVQLKEAW